MFNQGGHIDHSTPVSGPVSKYSAESEYNETCTSVMAIAHLSMLNN